MSVAMARTYAAVEIDRDVMPKGWKLVHSPSSSSSSSVELIRKLRQRGFFANFNSLQELNDECVRLSRLSGPEASSKFVELSIQPSVCSKESSSEAKNCQTEEAVVQSPPLKRVKGAYYPTTKPNQANQLKEKSLLRPDASPRALPKNAVVDDWYLSVGDGKLIPIMEVSYAWPNLSCTSGPKEAWLLASVNKEQEQYHTVISGWKLDLTAEGTLAIYVKPTMQVWTRLGKPEKLYEQTIRSVLVYLQLFSMRVTTPELTKSMLFQHLAAKFPNWQVKPDASDLHGSLILMKKLNLGCTYPLDRRVLARVEREVDEMGESDGENGGKPITFKRVRKHKTTMERQQTGHPLVGSLMRLGSFKGSSHGDDMSCSRHKVASKGTTPSAVSSELEQGEIASSSPSKSGGDHVLLGSKLQALKKRKATSQTGDDASMSDRLLGKNARICRESESDKEVNIASSEVDPSMGMASPLYKSEGAEGSFSCEQPQGNIENFDCKSRVANILMESQHDVLFGCKAGRINAYQTEPFPTIKRLWESTLAVRSALDCLERGGNLEEAQIICSRECLSDFVADEMALRQYGISQFSPSVVKQKEVAERINYYAHDGDTVVEISTRAVDYLSLLKERLASLGKLCSYKKFMVDHSQSQDIKEWMNLEGLPTGSKLLVCLSLSFTLWGEQTNRIIEYVLELKPKLIVLIAPLFSRRLEEHTSYNLIWVDSELLQDEILWPWGLFEISSAVLDKKKGASPSVFLWSRTDWTSTHKQIASRFGHLQRPVSRG